jgi:hypothetical protein
VLLALGLVGALVAGSLGGAYGSSHREAPLISEDPVADNTDLYAWVVNPEAPDAEKRVAIVANWIPLEEPASGPNFWKFGDDVLYQINIDNDGDSYEDIVYQFRFTTTVKDPNTFLYNDNTITVQTDAGGDAVDYPGLNVQQSYTVTEVRNGMRSVLGSGLLTPPVNVGRRSSFATSYDDLAAAAEYTLGDTGIEVFAGQRDEAFPVDLGSIFDLLGLRPLDGAHIISVEPGGSAPGVNNTDGYNVHSIVMEIPRDRLVEDDSVIGVWSTTLRRKTRIYQEGGATLAHVGPWVQVSRLGMPLVNEVVIPLGQKDRFNASHPSGDGRFLSFVTDPELGRLIPFLYSPTGIQVPPAPRNDLVTLFLTGIPGVNQPANVVASEMLRLNTSTASGFPNGRLLTDDVVDTALRVVAGVLVDGFNVFPNNALTDGVDGNDRPFLSEFPYMPSPQSGYDSIP